VVVVGRERRHGREGRGRRAGGSSWEEAVEGGVEVVEAVGRGGGGSDEEVVVVGGELLVGAGVDRAGGGEGRGGGEAVACGRHGWSLDRWR
jgi:hypothetical protein